MTDHLSISLYRHNGAPLNAGFVITRGSSGDVYASSRIGESSPPTWRPGNRRTVEIALEDLKREIDRQVADFLTKTDSAP